MLCFPSWVCISVHFWLSLRSQPSLVVQVQDLFSQAKKWGHHVSLLTIVSYQCQTHLTWIELEHFGVGGLWAIPWYSVLIKSCGPKCLDTLTKSSCTTQACQGDTSSKSWAFGLVSSDTKWQHMTHSSRETLHFLYLWEV